MLGHLRPMPEQGLCVKNDKSVLLHNEMVQGHVLILDIAMIKIWR
jgi:hypothetical protein